MKGNFSKNGNFSQLENGEYKGSSNSYSTIEIKVENFIGKGTKIRKIEQRTETGTFKQFKSEDFRLEGGDNKVEILGESNTNLFLA